ncbi:MAG: DUF4430 domain-containing protein [Syntrophomonadaceae bacterium]|nr:DUF4430 domain-containing protein [Syntrophomonadaceae bacterium]
MRRWSCLLMLILILLAAAAGCSQRQALDPGNTGLDSVPAESGSLAAVPADSSGSPTDAQSPERQESPDNPAAPEGSDSPVSSPALQTAEPVGNSPSAAGAGTVRLTISKNYGRETLAAKQAAIQADWTVLDLLDANTSVTTKYDGSFINGLAGIESDSGGWVGEKKDWFFYVNGICTDVGALGYTLRSGEAVWWDYHPWTSLGNAYSAVIGCYPEPFIHGYRGQAGPVTIMTAPDSQDLGSRLQTALKKQGAAAVTVTALDNNRLENRNGPVMVVGTWDQVKQMPWLAGLNEAYRKTGISVHFKDEGLELLDYKGGAARTISGSAGIIAACGSGLGDASPVWLVVGTDLAGAQQAVEVLVSNPAGIRQCYSVALTDGQLIRLPLQ